MDRNFYLECLLLIKGVILDFAGRLLAYEACAGYQLEDENIVVKVERKRK